jgi:hypothetical protein
MLPELDVQKLITTLLSFNLAGFAKLVLLVLLVLYAIFSIMLANQVRALARTVFFPSRFVEILIQFFAILYILAVVSLFFLTLVIL